MASVYDCRDDFTKQQTKSIEQRVAEMAEIKKQLEKEESNKSRLRMLTMAGLTTAILIGSTIMNYPSGPKNVDSLKTNIEKTNPNGGNGTKNIAEVQEKTNIFSTLEERAKKLNDLTHEAEKNLPSQQNKTHKNVGE